MIGIVDLAQHVIGVVGHASKKTCRACRTCTGAKFGEHARNPFGLQACEAATPAPRLPHSHTRAPLAAVVRARVLHHIALVNKLFEHAAERLLGDFQDVRAGRRL